MTRQKPVAIDLFAGAGGLSEGLHLGGWDVAVAVEKDVHAADTYDFNHNIRQNRNTKILRCEIENVGRGELQDALQESRGILLEEVELIAGGPPCQGFSYIGPRSLNDSRNRLFLEFIRIVNIVRPKAFIAENVKGILSFARHGIPKLLGQIFDRLGYNLSFDVVNSMEFGVPQDRIRVIFSGIRRDVADSLGFDFLSAPAPCMPDLINKYYKAEQVITLGEALSDLPLGRAVALESRIWVTDGDIHEKNREDEPYPYPESREMTGYQRAMRRQSTGIHNSHTKGMSQGRLEKVSLIPEGGVLASGGRDNAWRRLKWNRHAHTLQAHMGKDLKEFIHPLVDRWITVREAARLQSFDDAYVFLGSQSAQLSQVGNAVPPFVGWAAGRAIGEQLKLFSPARLPLRIPNPLNQSQFLLKDPRDARWFGLLEHVARDQRRESQIYKILHRLYDMMLDTAKDQKHSKGQSLTNKTRGISKDSPGESQCALQIDG
ncbi:MAG: Modification methylase HaeIII [Pelotomaculum sp. PtaU1.Bin035]|nr:MAG: Modification methylase HaeIII [Pelotomaculum sp. PtaU1.Bin035]